MAFSTESLQHDRFLQTGDHVHDNHAAQPNAIFVGASSDLKAVYQAPVNLAVWQRPVALSMLPVVRWLTKEPFELEFDVDVTDVSSTLQRHLSVPMEFDAARAQLIADVHELATLFSEYASTYTIRLMLESLHRVPCPKFHQDNVPLRLVCTYTGTGTEWLENSNVNTHPDCCGGSMALDPLRIMNLNPFEVALMKGKRWPGNKMGIFHRSPLVDADRPRLIVKMDVAQ